MLVTAVILTKGKNPTGESRVKAMSAIDDVRRDASLSSA